MNEYTEFVATLPLDEQMKMPLSEEDVESYNALIDHFLNYEVAGLDLFPVTYANIKANATEFNSRLKATLEIEASSLNRTREKLALAIPLMKEKDPEIAKLLEQNLKEIISFFKEHDINFEFGLSKYDDHLSPSSLAIFEAKKRLRGVNPDAEQIVIDNGVKNIINNLRKRPCDQKLPLEITLISSYMKDVIEGKAEKDPSTKYLDSLISNSLQLMAESNSQIEMSKAKAIEMSNYKKQVKLSEREAKNQRMSKAVDVLVEACKKRNKEGA
jgi:hypothetical protein